ncbi:MAG TPA: lysophospholipid acyltransferase family protein [Anaerolineales bacterium]
MRTFVSWFIRAWSSILCRIEHKPLTNVPKHGPLILAINHIGSLEVPLFAALLQPRKTIALAKIETWNNKLMGWLFDLWEAIPIRRGEVDLEAIRRCLIVLKAGCMLVVAPEGTRSYNGRLQRGQPGISFITLRSGSPILPIVHWGGENFGTNLRHIKRTDFHIRVGRPFSLDAKGQKVTREVRQVMADEIMYQLAVLMPEEYRGEYQNCDPPPTKYLRFA